MKWLLSKIFTSLILFVVFACSKGVSTLNPNPPPPPPPPSSEKTISTVIFKTEDNPSLQEQIAGLIVGDSIKMKFPTGINLNGLVPTITYTGNSITPANGTPQNFTNPVTYKVIAQDGSQKNYFFQCGFRNFDDTAALVKNRWGVIKDSVTNVNFAYPNGLIPIPGVYTGVPNDYYDFNANGRVYIFENNNSENDPYQILANGHISIQTFINYECAIQFLTSSRMTLYWAFTSSNGGQYTRTLYLKR